METGHFKVNIENENLNEIHINAIRYEYTKIDEKWLQLHYNTTVGLVIFSFFVEIFLGFIMINSDMLSTTVERFFFKFLFVPSGVNLICLAVDTYIMNAKKLSQTFKIYSISLIFVIISFTLFTVHSAFAATYYIFAIAIMLTTIYASYSVTIWAALTSLIALIASELLLSWDVDKISVYQSTHRLGEFLISIFVLIAFSITCMVAIRFEQKKTSASVQKDIERHQLQQSVYMDEMTGIYNRKAFHDELKYMEYSTFENTVILAIADIDKFKSVNDTWGHHIGDLCLIEFGKILREYDKQITPFRYGGDEFCLVFHNLDMKSAEALCGKIQSKVNRMVIEECADLKLTVSFGLAEITEESDTVKLFIHADRALYEAKEARNAIHVFK
ncbi:MAG: GGDEF domain-containing protein [Mobilitalea sp.]